MKKFKQEHECELFVLFPEFFIKLHFLNAKHQIMAVALRRDGVSDEELGTMFTTLDQLEQEMLIEKEKELATFSRIFSFTHQGPKQTFVALNKITNEVYYQPRSFEWGNKVCITSLGSINKDELRYHHVFPVTTPASSSTSTP
jgi:hypothetical protein